MKDPKVACIIMVVAIVLSILLGGHRSLSAEASKVEDIFYNGVDGDGLGVNSDLSHRVELAYNMVTIAKRYLPADDVDIKQVIGACSALENSGNPSDKIRANNELQLACVSLYERLEGSDLSQTDAEYRDDLMTNLYSRNHIISLDGYNQKALEFNISLNRFPANILSRITGIKPFALSQ